LFLVEVLKEIEERLGGETEYLREKYLLNFEGLTLQILASNFSHIIWSY